MSQSLKKTQPGVPVRFDVEVAEREPAIVLLHPVSIRIFMPINFNTLGCF
jgi:hypothetical protein